MNNLRRDEVDELLSGQKPRLRQVAEQIEDTAPQVISPVLAARQLAERNGLNLGVNLVQPPLMEAPEL